VEFTTGAVEQSNKAGINYADNNFIQFVGPKTKPATDFVTDAYVAKHVYPPLVYT
jgi:hypothetical protein